ncbi:hypothetical protein PR202_ga31186 [Eleusine coracana subsp. coracana]|uniref:AB hydrolase-1 domain-containing protein n=1 Tax=Eleusine coracana subsp. coracana TaxID=191504 RepID=A0AAV5DPD9_ELECO|nr:hypothetical protein PR202_ga31186 [Eleusine coracana subsp. coracana]
MNQKIEHSFLLIRGLKLHIAHTGKGFILPTVDYPVPIHITDSLSQPSAGEIGTLLFVHGFPEVWYSWRHQMVAAAAAGFRAIAPDFPGYGLSEPPTDLAQASWEALMKVLLAILDSLSISKEPGRAEADFGRFNARRIMRTIYILFSKSEVPVAKQGQEIVNLAEESTPLPDWFTEEDLSAYTTLTKPSKVEYATPKFQMPMFVIMGERDYILKFPALNDYISSQKLKDIAPDHEISYISEGSHFVQEQFPDLVNHLIIDFVSKHL